GARQLASFVLNIVQVYCRVLYSTPARAVHPIHLVPRASILRWTEDRSIPKRAASARPMDRTPRPACIDRCFITCVRPEATCHKMITSTAAVVRSALEGSVAMKTQTLRLEDASSFQAVTQN